MLGNRQPTLGRSFVVSQSITVAALLAALSCAQPVHAAASKTTAPRPNILIIVADDK